MSLGDYATERSKVPTLSLFDYLKMSLDRTNIAGLPQFIKQSLESGRCLVMLDGLDEVSSHQLRREIQEALKDFVLEYRDTSSREKTKYNRFLISSRVAGYDQMAFPDYPHFTISELTSRQIENFLPRWCRANVRRDRHITIKNRHKLEKAIEEEANQRAKQLHDSIIEHQGIKDLAENPLLLTLLAVMQQNSIELPRQRVELYNVIARTLLENRNIAKKLPPIPEAQAVQRLGPIAFQMQEEGNSFARYPEVMDSLKKSISLEGGTSTQIEQEAENFLKRIRERGGLFVLRTGDYFGFFHRTFQEYFAARYLLSEIEWDRKHGISELVRRAHRLDDLWREPFLLAVAYKSGEDGTIASELIRSLLSTSLDNSAIDFKHDLLLAGECIVESKPLTIEPALEKEIAKQLLRTYERALLDQSFSTCSQIERIMRRWFLSLPREAYRPSLLSIIQKAVCDIDHLSYQYATLVLLYFIAGELVNCPTIVFDTLLPPLLALTGLPSVGGYQPTTNLLAASNLEITEVSLSILCLLQKQGPSGLLRDVVREHFEEYPEHLGLLADFSLMSNSLLTPSFIPYEKVNFDKYVFNVWRWLLVRDQLLPLHNRASRRSYYFQTHRSLLSCVEEVRYPMSLYLLKILQSVKDSSNHDLQQACESYISDQLMNEDYISYQEGAFLWMILFPKRHSLEKLSNLLLIDYNSNQETRRRNSRRFLSSISYPLRNNYVTRIQTKFSSGRTTKESNKRDLYQHIFRNFSEIIDIMMIRDINNIFRKRTRIMREFIKGYFEIYRDIFDVDEWWEWPLLILFMMGITLFGLIITPFAILGWALLGERLQILLRASPKKIIRATLYNLSLDRKNLSFRIDRGNPNRFLLRDSNGKIDLHLWNKITEFWPNVAMEDRKEIWNVKYLPAEIKTLQTLLISHELTIKTINNIAQMNKLNYANKLEYIDYLTIISGRLLQFQDNDEIGEIQQDELEKIIQLLRKNFVSIQDIEIRNAWLDIVRYLPACSEYVIKLILQLAEEATDKQLLEAYSEVIKYSEPNSVEAWEKLKSGIQTKVDIIKVAIEERLKRENEKPAIMHTRSMLIAKRVFLEEDFQYLIK